MSILFLYRRLFTLLIRWFCITFYVLQSLSVGSGISISLALLLRCIPISSNWDPTIRGARCGVNVATLARTSCVVNLVVDLCVVAAPTPLILIQGESRNQGRLSWPVSFSRVVSTSIQTRDVGHV